MNYQKLTWISLAVAVLIAAASVFHLTRPQISYNEEIRPIFNKKCIVCHGGVKKSGGFSLLFREEALAKAKSGKYAIVPGDADNSELMKRLKTHDKDARMPLDAEPLSDDEISKIEKWINEGAQWEDHWAYIKPDKSIAPPNVSDKWIVNDIDNFIIDKLKKEGLTHSPEADKTALLRRLSLDLIGLPPTIEETQAFLKDNSTDAYEKQVDRLLQSPQFGERWATMWLDLARYADSKGYEKDLDRSIWQYRDWVIKAFNADMPFDQFTIHQLAGDLLPQSATVTAGEIENRLIATAFHRNTMANDEGGTNDEEFRNMALLDRVSTTWEVWQGTTMACVQCHSHPYDPFRQKDFYQSFAFFNNTQDRDLYNDKPLLKTYSPAKEQELKNMLTRLKSIEKNPEPVSAKIPLDKQKQDYLRRMGIYRIEAEDFDSASRHIELWNNQKTIMQTTEGAYTVYEDVDLTGVTKVTYGYQSGAENAFIEMRLGSSEGELISKVETKCSEETVNDGWSRWKDYTTSTGNIKPTKGVHDVYLVYRKGKSFWTDLIHLDWMDLQLNAPLKNKFPTAFRDSLDKLVKIESITTPVIMEMAPSRSRKTHVFIRGNWMVHGDQVKADVPGSLPKLGNYKADRLGFAQWLVSKDNPLTARVMVNRFWEQLFGNGIVESLEDFGTMGAKPSHPELLDWLAVQLMDDHKWSVKKLLKQMVMSATYRQSETVSKELIEKDPRNLLLARGPRVRLSSEQIRDQALFVSHLLNKEMYGPSVKPPNPTDESWRREPKGNLYRRAVYTYWRRTNPYPSMITFDSPQRNVCTSRRIRTNTPLQALTTLNDTVYYAAAQSIALKMKAVKSSKIDDKLKQGYQYLFQEAPSENKTRLLHQLYQEALFELRRKKDNDAELGALTLTANAMMNLDEFLTK